MKRIAPKHFWCGIGLAAVPCLAAGGPGSAAPTPNLLNNGGFECVPEQGSGPDGFRVSPVDSRTKAAGTWRFVADSFEGARAIEILRTNTDGGFALWFDIPTFEAAPAPRRMALRFWVKRIGKKSRAGMPQVRWQVFNPEWTGACRMLEETEASPYAAGWAKQAVLLEQQPGKTLQHLRLSVEVKQPGDGMVLDDAALYDVTSWPAPELRALLAPEEEVIPEKEVDRFPAKKGNILANSSFELGLSGGWSIRDLLPGEQRGAVIDSAAFHGGRGVRLGFVANGSATLCHRFRTARVHQTHTLSAWCKAEASGARVTLRFENGYVPDAGRPHTIQKAHDLPGGEWKRLEVSGLALAGPASAYAVTITAAGQEPGAVLVDAVQFEEGSATAYRPRAEIEAALHLEDAAGITAWDQPASYDVAVYNSRDATATPGLRVECSDFFGRTVYSRSLEARSFSPGLNVIRQEHAAAARGSLRLRVRVQDREEFDDEITLTSVPPARHVERHPASRFGQHVRLEPWQLSVAKRLGACWVRLHDVEPGVVWDSTQPEPDRWVWVDEQIALAHEARMEILGVFGRTPAWALPADSNEARSGGGWKKPVDLDAWTEYVRRAAEHYRGRIDAWEIWNEPYGGGFGGFTGAEYAALAKRACAAAKKGNPQCMVLGLCTWEGAVDFNRDALAAGAVDFCDAVSYHLYTRNGRDAYSRGMLLKERLDLERRGKRLWMSEGMGGYTRSWHSFLVDAVDDSYSRNPGAPAFTAEEAAITGAVALASVLANGAEKAFWYWSPWEGSGSIRPDRYTWFEYDGQLKPHAAAYAVSAHFLDDAKPMGQGTLGEEVKICLFERDGGATGVLWSETGRERQVAIRRPDAEWFDLMGNALPAEAEAALVGRVPVYLRAAGCTVRELLSALSLPSSPNTREKKP